MGKVFPEHEDTPTTFTGWLWLGARTVFSLVMALAIIAFGMWSFVKVTDLLPWW
jgi:flagellar biogenesis protein FliO